ncbi:MAG: SIMPL domain-containing protein [Succinivibrionaceae bacterium]|nr:SIMPL domain-containing protein [Ruminobacter sp.]MDY5779248.1 SIMPL domain-containing protein [Succinivibrionaceae bacterium]MEE1340947.1 SIMPL domain-containing protein [Succinivibrionaceae bacterium]
MSNYVKILIAVIFSLVLVVSAYLLAPLVPKVVEMNNQSTHIVTVKGVSEKIVKADELNFTLELNVFANTSKEGGALLDNETKILLDYLVSSGLPKEDIFFKEINVNKIDNPNLPKLSFVKSFGVVTKKVDIGQMILKNLWNLNQKNMGVGASQWNINYVFNGLNEIKPQMIEEATKNARVSANVFAKSSNLHIDKIKHASQGQFSIEDDSKLGYKKVRVVTTVDFYLAN